MMLDASEDWSASDAHRLFGQLAQAPDPDAFGLDDADDGFGDLPMPLGTWSPSAIRRTARLLLAWQRAGDPRAEVLAASCQAQAERQGSMFARSAIVALVDVQPPALIEAIASTRARHLVGSLAKAVSFARADDDVRIALANTVGELGGDTAIALLEGWAQRPDLSPSVAHELRFARRLAGRRR